MTMGSAYCVKITFPFFLCCVACTANSPNEGRRGDAHSFDSTKEISDATSGVDGARGDAVTDNDGGACTGGGIGECCPGVQKDCNGICGGPGGSCLKCEGNYDIQNLVAFTAIQDCSWITGNVSVQIAAMAGIYLPQLVRVDGDALFVEDEADDTISAPYLVHVGGTLAAATCAPVDFSNLEYVEKVFNAYGPFDSITKLKAAGGFSAVGCVPSLLPLQGAIITGPLNIGATSTLTSLDGLAGATQLTSIKISNSSLVTAVLPNLTLVTNSVLISKNNLLMTMSFPLLNDSTLNILDNDALTSMSFPSLSNVDSILSLTGNAVLSDLSGFDNLQTITPNGDIQSLTIKDNPSLPTCQAVALLNRLISNGFENSAGISGNDNNATCM